MRKKQFKAESKRLLDLMIHSIYTHKEIFLRELISNASDAIDKIYYKTLSDETLTFNKEDYYIRLEANKEARTLTITDTGIGFSKVCCSNLCDSVCKLRWNKSTYTNKYFFVIYFIVLHKCCRMSRYRR